ncbi:hypothetical protein JB92DRAFT_221166 [Gautieria morchelliformis]|nr:hypothetical protein JB92DRAFT_221166 [Gautieria morchelliformis]
MPITDCLLCLLLMHSTTWKITTSIWSDHYVCPACGSLDECEHDRDTEAPVESPDIAYNGDDTCEMVTKLPIGPGEEVFNSYEKGLTNAELLCQYGFILDVNENNIVTFDELLRDSPEETRNLWRALVARWPSNPGWDDVQLVFNPRIGGENEDGVTLKRANSSQLELNADGQISHQLWLFLFTLGRSGVPAGTNEALLEAQQAARAQELIEAVTSGVTILDAGRPWTDEYRDALYLLRIIAEKLIQICEAKIGSAHHAGMAASRIGELLDEMPAERRLTRLAISYALEERKMVEACLEAWAEFAECAGSSGTTRDPQFAGTGCVIFRLT